MTNSIKALFIVATFISTTVFASPNMSSHHKHEQRFEKMVTKLELTEAQSEKVRQIKEEAKSAAEEHRVALKALKQQQKELDVDAQDYLDSVSVLVDEESTHILELTKIKRLAFAKIKQSLTVEQRKKFAKLKRKFAHKKHKRRNKSEAYSKTEN